MIQVHNQVKSVDNRTQAQRRADRVARLGEARVREIEERDAAARRAGAE